MKFLCLGYNVQKAWDGSLADPPTTLEDCIAYDNVLVEKGRKLGGAALDCEQPAVTLRYQNGKVSRTDGPFVETKELLGGILMIEAKDMAEAVELFSKHPALRFGGPFDIRVIHEDVTRRSLERMKSV